MAKPQTVAEALDRMKDPVVQRINFYVNDWSQLLAVQTVDELVSLLEAWNAPPELVEMVTGDQTPQTYLQELTSEFLRDESHTAGAVRPEERLAMWDQWATPEQNAMEVKQKEDIRVSQYKLRAKAAEDARAQTALDAEEEAQQQAAAATPGVTWVPNSGANLDPTDPAKGWSFKIDATGVGIQVDAQGNELPNSRLYINGVVSPTRSETDDPSKIRYIGGLTGAYQVTNPKRAELERRLANMNPYAGFAALDQYNEDIAKLPETVGPQYLPEAEWAMFSSKSTEYKTEVQRRLVDAGAMSEADFAATKGFWNDASAEAMKSVMDIANHSGYTWLEVADRQAARLAAMTDDEKLKAAGRAGYTIPAYQAPDYASLTQAVRQTFTSILGREPKDYEIALAAQQLQDDYRSQYDVQKAAGQSEYNAGNRAILTGDTQAAGSFTQVDPLSRLNERLTTDYAQEIDRKQRVAELHNNFLGMTQTLSGLTGTVRGG